MTTTVNIIGAGPAGCSAGIMLAQAGFAVTIFESSAIPREHPGETLHPGIEPLLKTLGVADDVNAAGFLRFPGIRIAWQEDAEHFEAFWQ